MIHKYRSTKEAIAKIYRDLNLDSDTRWQDMVEWIGEALPMMHVAMTLLDKVASIEISGYKGELPCDLYQVVQINHGGVPMTLSTNTFRPRYHASNEGATSRGNSVYSIDDAYLKTSFEKGKVEISYKAIPLDCDGFPLIPDDPLYMEALVYFVAMKLSFPDYVAGKQTRFDNLQQLWFSYCGKAKAKAKMPDLAMMENLRRTMVRLIPQMNFYNTNFTDQNDIDPILNG